ncbi:gluconokinase [Pseudomonas panipatensis]|uniref:Gluconokinase n=1 Tax=Pseudomonas panipatensis TaxID=428992 RepID=A0A1G8HIH7_9PSED|nr:gluconokinase [Pseudomonas panipatensis]SDI06429.1 gluconokinase [Pseudomonas panipatensis]SMP58453.1 gluconate kinase, SKI family [Pseudomonas panipatensis]
MLLASPLKDSAVSLPRRDRLPPIQALLIMGVAGCGKSSVSQTLCRLSGAHGIEGDAFHPADNIRKMSAGIPLTDEDRAGWLASLADELRKSLAAGQRPVLTCSALKHSYRERLREAVPGLGVVFLELTPEVAARRVADRPGHFMPATLIDSQFAALEPPRDEPLTLVVDATLPVERIAATALAWWHEHDPV